ncbi:unnamed protein product [Toxocara canis]|uniref:Uncharacterized protein n=1 Tax=Toxocara canis TaxID=6265 RepID=A0A183UB49_TOXCA|nr:unnamed protein product [Toxocara canis]
MIRLNYIYSTLNRGIHWNDDVRSSKRCCTIVETETAKEITEAVTAVTAVIVAACRESMTEIVATATSTITATVIVTATSKSDPTSINQ